VSFNIAAAERIIFVSPASLWEIAIKISLDKYKLPEDFEQFWDKQLHLNDFKLLPVSIAHTSFVVDLPSAGGGSVSHGPPGGSCDPGGSDHCGKAGLAL